MLNQQFAVNFKNKYTNVIIAKLVLSALFLSMLTWAYEDVAGLVTSDEAAHQDPTEDKREAAEMKVIAIVSSFVFLVFRSVEIGNFCLIRRWASARDNFMFHNAAPILEYDDTRLKKYFTQMESNEP